MLSHYHSATFLRFFKPIKRLRKTPQCFEGELQKKNPKQPHPPTVFNPEEHSRCKLVHFGKGCYRS